MSFWGAPVQISVASTSPTDNDRSTRETISQMIYVSRVCSQSPVINNVVAGLVKQLPRNAGKTDLVRKIFWFVKNHIVFREDESILANELGYGDPVQELLISPVSLLSMPQPQGDCDDFSMLVASLCLASRVHCWFVTIAVDEQQPDRWSHVYCMVETDGVMYPIDASHGNCPGWQTDRQIFKRGEWFVG